MKVSDALRRIKRQFGDEYNVIIYDQDIFDWIYDAELDIIRATADNEYTLQIPSNQFPVPVPDKVNIKRLSVDGAALTHTTVSELDLNKVSLSHAGGFNYWYMNEGRLCLWPMAEVNSNIVIEVNYSKTPMPMSVVAPYLNYTDQTTIVQVATVPSDIDWQETYDVNVEMDVILYQLRLSTDFISCHNNSVVAPNFHFSIAYDDNIVPMGTGFYMNVSDGTTSRRFDCHFLTPIVSGERFKFRFSYNSVTSDAILYRTDLITGIETLQSTHDISPTVWQKQVAQPGGLFIGNMDGVYVDPSPEPMKIYSIEMWYNATKEMSIFKFDAEQDLGSLSTTMIDVITTTSGHIMTLKGGLLIPAYNEFTVPEVYHEDVVKYCLARAHTKNQNFRAAEAEMEQYDRRVSTRRNEAQAPETALYKIPDPEDYSDYVY